MSEIVLCENNYSSTMEFNSLHDEDLEIIFSHMTISNRINCELVCKRWRKVLTSMTIRSLKVVTEKDIRDEKPLCDDVTHWAKRQNTIYVNEKNLKQAFLSMFRKYKGILALHLQVNDIRALRKQEFFAFMKLFTPYIVHLELDFEYGPFVKEDLMHMIHSWTARLTHFVLRYRRDRCKQMTEKSIMKVFEPCINIEIFCWDSTEMAEQRLEYCPQKLSSMYLPNNQLSTKSIEIMATECGVQILELQLGSINVEQLQLICNNMPNLRLLSTNSFEVGADLDQMRLIANMPLLHTLELTMHGDKAETQLLHIIKSCPGIRRLKVCEMEVTNTLLNALPNLLPNIKSLQLYGMLIDYPMVDDEGIYSLIKCKHLQEICVPIERVSEETLLKLVSQRNLRIFIARQALKNEEQLVDLMRTKALEDPYYNYIMNFLCKSSCLNPVLYDNIPSNLQLQRTYFMARPDEYED